MLNTVRVGLVEERVGKGFSRKECPDLSREREEVSQVKTRDGKEVKQKARVVETRTTDRNLICCIRELGLYSISNCFKHYARASDGQTCTVDFSLW